jgi:ABC-type multidrug transport system fused ATPase/permease subunit
MKAKIKYLFQIINKIRLILLQEHKTKLPGVYINMLIASVFEMLGVAAIIPFINAVTNADALMKNKYIIPVVRYFHIKDKYALLLLVGIGIVIIYIVKNAYIMFARSQQQAFELRVYKDLSTQMLNAYMLHPYTFFLEHGTGEIMRGITTNVSSVQQELNCLFTILAESVTAFFIIIFMFFTDPVLTVGIAVIMVICTVLVTYCFKRRLLRAGMKYNEANAEQNKYAIEAVSGIKDITVMQRRDQFVRKFEKASDKVRGAQLVYQIINMAPERLTETFFVCGIIMIVVFRIRWGMDVVSYVPKLASFAVAAFRMLPSINKLSSNINSIAYLSPSLDITFQNIMEARTYTAEQGQYRKDHGNENETEIVNLEFENVLEIKDINWRYNASKSDVLHGLSMTIHKGESVGFIGESGAGKTTLSDCILGLLHPQAGSIEMDGHDIFAMPKTWSHIIGYVPQSVYLIDDTIRANISFGLNDDEVSDDKIWAALRDAQLEDFVKELPQQLDTFVGERGVRFSGGQRQRVAIARALYYNPFILVLDEATSALDNETDAAVMEAIDSLQGSHTLIIVAHRLSTIANCDTIYEIKDGKAYKRNKAEIV